MPEEKGTNQSSLNRETILKAFQDISDALERRGTSGEICILGGTVMVLAFAARLSTKDVDAIFHPADVIREVAREVGEKHGFPPNWLNDAAKGFVSARHQTIQDSLPQFSHLRVMMPAPEYLLAMKCMASRIGAATHDVSDIVFLIRHLKLKDASEVMGLVVAYYPKDRVPVKAQYLVEGLFAEGEI